MEFGLICLILEISRVKLESGNVIRVRKMTQFTRVTQLEFPTLLKKQSYRAQVARTLVFQLLLRILVRHLSTMVER